MAEDLKEILECVLFFMYYLGAAIGVALVFVKHTEMVRFGCYLLGWYTIFNIFLDMFKNKRGDGEFED